MDDSGGMDVLHGAHDGANQLGGIALGIITFGTNSIEEFTTGAEVEDEIEIVRGLEVVVKGYDIAVAT